MNTEDCKRVGLAAVSRNVFLEKNPYTDHDLIKKLIRDALLNAGLGKENPNIPLADIIQPGMKVLLKPNWVLHYNQSGHNMDCLVTNPTFILAALDEVFATKPSKVIIGDAPIQSCKFDSIFTSEWKSKVEKMANCQVEIIDFRRTIRNENDISKMAFRDVRDESFYVLFNLGNKSLLEPISSPEGHFRITNYNPDDLAKTHRSNHHQYLISREAFETDVFINLPKLKTHKKAGITAALKNIVGINGNKEYLPHHRIGGSALGGDCYPGFSPLKYLSEFCLDKANRRIGEKDFKNWQGLAYRFLSYQKKIGNPEIEGSWYGNDTVWRMCLDLNRILIYGRSDGTLSNTPERRIYSLTDAIIAGEKNGPLAPTPINLGVVTFAFSSPFADLVHSALMRFDWKKIHLIREAFGNFYYPLAGGHPEDCEIYFQQNRIFLDEIMDKFSLDFDPPKGWKHHIELDSVRSIWQNK